MVMHRSSREVAADNLDWRPVLEHLGSGSNPEVFHTAVIRIIFFCISIFVQPDQLFIFHTKYSIAAQ
jgi:hypothetical protein